MFIAQAQLFLKHLTKFTHPVIQPVTYQLHYFFVNRQLVKCNHSAIATPPSFKIIKSLKYCRQQPKVLDTCGLCCKLRTRVECAHVH